MNSFINDMEVYSTKHYLSPEGRNLFLDWLKQVRDPIAKVQILKRINRLQLGNFGDRRFCRQGVWELRIDSGIGYRVYYALAESNLVLLLCGGGKSSQRRDIDRAVQYWEDRQRRPERER